MIKSISKNTDNTTTILQLSQKITELESKIALLESKLQLINGSVAVQLG